jgi:predicted dehydrogenase
VEIAWCADLDRALAERRADELDIPNAGSPAEAASDELGAAPLVVNLTPPSAHAPVTADFLDAGKHVYTEKPLATSVADARSLVVEAAARGLRLGCAPDTFLGGAYEAGRELIEQGAIGEPLGATTTLLVGGPESWHPNADVFYREGGGPMLDLAPYYLTAVASLLGSYATAFGFAGTPTPLRELGVGPRAGEQFSVDVPTHAAALLRLERGAFVTLTVSFEASGQYESTLLVHGSEGTLELPDANGFEGDVRVRTARGDWENVPYESRGAHETRGYGLHDLFESLDDGRPHRASGELGLHVLETATAVLRAAGAGRAVDIVSRIPSDVPQPKP